MDGWGDGGRDASHTDISASLKSAGGWATAPIAVGGEAVIRLSFTAPTTTSAPVPPSSFRLTARSGDHSDAVVGEIVSQFITALEWSVDNVTWTPVTSATTVELEQCDSVALRTRKSAPDAGWPQSFPLGPKWTWHGVTFQTPAISLDASELSLSDAGEAATFHYGSTTLTWHIHVVASDAYFQEINP